MLSAIRRSAAAAARQRVVRSYATDTVKVSLPQDSFAYYDLPEGSIPLEMDMTKDELVDMYRLMVTVRRLEMSCDALYKAKEIRGFCHLSIGQEAIAVGIEKAITKDDSVITSYRCHGFAFVRGSSAHAIIAELLGRKTGVSKGKGGSMHMFAPGFYGGNGIVGAQVPLGLGIGYAHQYKNDGTACFTLYGDGAANQGQVFESYNMAKLWNVPVVFACENNKYGMGTSSARSSALSEYYKRGQYIPGVKINGMDALACFAGSKFAKEYTGSGKGPIVLEYETYRYGGHSMSDPGTTYRTREEIQNMRSQHDPVTGLKMRLIELGVADEKELKSIDKEARAFIDEQTKLALADEFPAADGETLFDDIYARGSEPEFLRGRIPEENFYFNKSA